MRELTKEIKKMKLEELVNLCTTGQMFSIRNYRSKVTIYSGKLGIDALICQYAVCLITTQDDFMVVYVDFE